VWLQVRNRGNADATNVTVEFFLRGDLEHTERDLTVPAQSTILVFYRTTARYGDTHSARAFSDLYETDEVSRTLVTREVDLNDEPSGDAAYFVAMLALVISLIALAVATMILRNMPRT
jgi:hypothetical protein